MDMQEIRDRVSKFDAYLDQDAAYKAADEAYWAFHRSPVGEAMTEHFLASGGWLSTFPDADALVRADAHLENRNRDFDRVVHAYVAEHGAEAL